VRHSKALKASPAVSPRIRGSILQFGGCFTPLRGLDGELFFKHGRECAGRLVASVPGDGIDIGAGLGEQVARAEQSNLLLEGGETAAETAFEQIGKPPGTATASSGDSFRC